MALKGAIENEMRKIRRIAVTAAVKLGFKPGKGLVEAVYLEYEWQTGQRSNPAQAARVRCLEALWAILDPRCANDTDAVNWIWQVDQSSAVLRRDVINAASAPDNSILQAFESAGREASANALRAACPVAA